MVDKGHNKEAELLFCIILLCIDQSVCSFFKGEGTQTYMSYKTFFVLFS